MDATLHLDRDDEGEAGLAEPRRAGQQNVIAGLTAPACCRHKGLQLAYRVLLPDEVAKPAGT